MMALLLTDVALAVAGTQRKSASEEDKEARKRSKEIAYRHNVRVVGVLGDVHLVLRHVHDRRLQRELENIRLEKKIG